MACAAIAGAAMLISAGCTRRSVARFPAPPAQAAIGSTETGLASWYGIPYHGRFAASGEIFDMEQLTAAHRTLPFDTWVEVTNLANGKRVDVRINDRGPFVRGRIIDLSQAAAREISLIRPGVARVRLQVIEPPVRPAVKRATARETPQVSVVTEGYTVQAGAFSDRERAESFAAALSETFQEVRVVRAATDTSLWRVRVGCQMTLQAAAELAARVREASGEAVVIQDREQ